MSAYEMMLSESQERMLMVIRPGREDLARVDLRQVGAGFRRHRPPDRHRPARGAPPGRSGGGHSARIRLPSRRRAITAPIDRAGEAAADSTPVGSKTASASSTALLTLIGCPDLASRAWVWNQYDSTIGGQTVKRPGEADAAIVRIEGSARALALTTDCTPRYCAADPEAGGAQAVAEAWRNLTASGARPLAVTDNLNFGNPEKPEIMGQFAAAIRGMAAACRALDFPVVSGNVSLYNETEGRAILPTPAIGGLGVHRGRGAGAAVSRWHRGSTSC